ncbi:cytochrome P450 [Peniophora sp. CONT]|nr:cytochrome P450 [Peniophora sp. CONT]
MAIPLDYVVVTCAVLAIAARSLYPIFRPFLLRFWTPIRHLAGPPSVSFVWGNTKQLENDMAVLLSSWIAQYGKVFKVNAEFGMRRLFLADPRAVGHVLNYSDIYQKPEMTTRALMHMVGKGVLTVEGDAHKKHRRSLNPAFGLAQLREMTTIFTDKSIQLRDVLLAKIGDNDRTDLATTELDIVPLLHKCTLDIIGMAGFEYDFGVLTHSDRPNELNDAMRKMFSTRFSFLDIVHNLLPTTRIIPSKRDKVVQHARSVMDAVGYKLIARMKADVLASAAGGSVQKKDIQGKSLLSLLVKANMASDLPESQRLSDEEILAQCPTFIIAGHETTSTSVTWITYALSSHPEVQDKLRAEILGSDFGDRPSMAQLSELKYLDAVVRETLRVYPPVPLMTRAVTESGVIPTEETWVDAHGVQQSGVRVTAGDTVSISIMAIHHSKDIWGEDADVFRPERWLDGPPAGASALTGIWANSLTFSGGPRSCIGYLFSVVETKALVYSLIRSLRFSLAVPLDDIAPKSRGIMRPFRVSEPEAGAQLLVKISAV